MTDAFQVNTYTPGDQRSAVVAAESDGDFVVIWEDKNQDGCDYGLFGQRFAALPTLDVDSNGSLDPLTDGLLVLRCLFGFTGATLTDGAIGAGCARCDATTIDAYLDEPGLILDIDGNADLEALKDGLLVLRYQFGFIGATLTTGATGGGCTRCDATTIEPYLLGLSSRDRTSLVDAAGRRDPHRIAARDPAAGQIDFVAGAERRVRVVVVGRHHLRAARECGVAARRLTAARLAGVGVGARAHQEALRHQLADARGLRDRLVQDQEGRLVGLGRRVDEEHATAQRRMISRVAVALGAGLVEHEEEPPARVVEERPATGEHRLAQRRAIAAYVVRNDQPLAWQHGE